ncbi:phage late control D family protein [Pantanalinema rosaneae CENA516]|uniref:phage late control D family protein n=1 Tax=Pantanalinema rosaneae TaxID=1620701 RepID=UPI003D6E299B
MPDVISQNLLSISNFAVIINGTLLPMDGSTLIHEIVVDEDLDLPGMFTLELVNLDVQGGKIAHLDDANTFAIGNVIEIKLGYLNALKTLIVGEITGLEPTFLCNAAPSLVVRGYDRRHRLQRGRHTCSFVQKKDSDIAAQIASNAGLTAQVENSQVIHDYVLQANQTDLEFLQQRAQQIQYEVVVEDKTLFFRPIGLTRSENVTLNLMSGLLEFYPRLSTVGQVNEVQVRGWDPKEQKEILGKAQTGDEMAAMAGQESGSTLSKRVFGAAVGVVSNRPVMSQAEADQVAKARFNQAVLMLITGEGVCQGRPDVRAGQIITLEGLGQRFSGQYYVTATSHRYSAEGYFTHFTVRRNAL